jgi:hypothetical protein
MAEVVVQAGRPVRRWAYVDATRTGDWWTCVLDDRECIRVVKVHVTTGSAAVVFTSRLPMHRDGSP